MAMKLYEIEQMREDAINMAVEMLEEGTTIGELIDEVGLNNITIADTGKGGYLREHFTEEELTTAIVDWEMYPDGDGYTVADVWFS